MTSDTLRRAAALIRERAEKATPGPWSAARSMGEDLHWGRMQFTTLDAPDRNLFAIAGMPLADAEHIAAWHPAVALAAATWLEHEADRAERFGDRDSTEHALAFATAYLGEET
jgi:hypothetical protein